MKTDAEITRLAATKVMGWTWARMDSAWMACSLQWQPLTDWRAAGEIVEKMRADGWNFSLEVGMNAGAAFTRYFSDERNWTYDKSALRAITIAALRALGVEL